MGEGKGDWDPIKHEKNKTVISTCGSRLLTSLTLTRTEKLILRSLWVELRLLARASLMMNFLKLSSSLLKLSLELLMWMVMDQSVWKSSATTVSAAWLIQQLMFLMKHLRKLLSLIA